MKQKKKKVEKCKYGMDWLQKADDTIPQTWIIVLENV